ncbi:IPExxxVDY family protein [Bacteroidota bacterium]
MSKKVHKLEFRPDYDFSLIGISSHENDYRISWGLNNCLNLKFIKNKDLEIIDNNYPEPQKFSQFSYEDEESMLCYKLIANRCSDGFLIGEMKNIDYFLIIIGETNKSFFDQFIKKIISLSMVIMAFEIDPLSLKSKQKLLF